MILLLHQHIKLNLCSFLVDTFADVGKHFPDDSFDSVNNTIHGCIWQLQRLKRENRKLKTLLSIGGYSYSDNFQVPVASKDGRNKFAETAVQLVEDLGFDGIVNVSP